MEGTKELKEVVAFGLSVHVAWTKAKADGKLDWKDLLHAVMPAKNLLAALQGVSKVPAELKDLTDAERSELMSWAQAEYDIPNDRTEELVEGALALALHAGQYVGAVVLAPPTETVEPATPEE